ncbi:MAG: alpha-amlyase [Flavobacterium sp. BFFFF2]|nr:MAG: alpha-amlyase [Flavobacterium sp. BFFFF2]
MNKPLIYCIALICFWDVFSQFDRVEPPFWWKDMQRSEVEVMFYGKNIADFDVSSTINGLITGVRKTGNPNYLFVTLETSTVINSSIELHFTKEKKNIIYNYKLLDRKNNSSMRASYDSSDVIYLLMPDRFSNGSVANDQEKSVQEQTNRNLPGGRHGGDIKGVINHVDYLKKLGVTTIWSTPLCEDNDTNYSYHGYGQSDVYKIDPRYGTNEEYVQLSSSLKQNGMKLIMDYVTNHWGAEHWMFKDQPTYDWFHQFPGYGQTNYRMSTQFDQHASERDAHYCMDGWFVKSMPDLNQGNELVLHYLIQNAIWWIEYADLDGFRVDTYSYGDKKGMATWTKAITDEYPNFNIVGEVWMSSQAQMAYWQKDSKIGAIQSYNSHLPSVMDFTLQEAIASVFNEDQSTWDKGLVKLYNNFTNDFLYPNPNSLLVFMENHDTARFNHIYPDFSKYRMALSLILTTRGIPQLYYGTELGMAGDKNKGDADIRQDFPGGWAGDKQNAFVESQRTEQQQKYYAFTEKLLNWRKGKTVIHQGKLTHFVPQDNVYVYFRHNDHGEMVMVVLNNNSVEKKVDLAPFHELLKGKKSGKEVISDQVFSLDQPLKIEAKGVLILELQ